MIDEISDIVFLGVVPLGIWVLVELVRTRRASERAGRVLRAMLTVVERRYR